MTPLSKEPSRVDIKNWVVLENNAMIKSLPIIDWKRKKYSANSAIERNHDKYLQIIGIEKR